MFFFFVEARASCPNQSIATPLICDSLPTAGCVGKGKGFASYKNCCCRNLKINIKDRNLSWDAVLICPCFSCDFYCNFVVTEGVCRTVPAPECTALGLHDTSLPNVFNHTDLTAAKAFFDTFNNQSCSPRAVYYTCLMVFPLCDKRTGTTRIPCQEDCLGTPMYSMELICTLYITNNESTMQCANFIFIGILYTAISEKILIEM